MKTNQAETSLPGNNRRPLPPNESSAYLAATWPSFWEEPIFTHGRRVSPDAPRRKSLDAAAKMFCDDECSAIGWRGWSMVRLGLDWKILMSLVRLQWMWVSWMEEWITVKWILMESISCMMYETFNSYKRKWIKYFFITVKFTLRTGYIGKIIKRLNAILLRREMLWVKIVLFFYFSFVLLYQMYLCM